MPGRFSPGAQFRRAVRENARLQKAEAGKPRPNPLAYVDLNSGEQNSLVTPGGMDQIIGNRLRFDPADANQGLFFIAADNNETRVTVVGKNLPGELMFFGIQYLFTHLTQESRLQSGKTRMNSGFLPEKLRNMSYLDKWFWVETRHCPIPIELKFKLFWLIADPRQL